MGRQGRRTLATLGLAGALTLGGATGAVAAPTWLQPVPLSSPPGPQNGFAIGAGTPDVEFDAAGNVVAAWQRLSSTDPPVVQVTFRNAGGGFTPATDIGQTAESLIGVTNAPQLEVDAAGNALLAFPSQDGRVMLAERAPGGGFSTPAEASTGTGNENIALDMSSTGHAVLAWQDGASHVQVRVRAPGGSFGAPTDLGVDAGFSLASPQVAINDQGAAVVAWVGNDGADDRIRARVRTAGGTFAAAPEQQVSNAGDPARDPDVGIDPQGRATAIWVRTVGSDSLVESKQANDAGTFPGATDQVSSTGADGSLPQVLVDNENTAVAVWNNGSTVTGSSRQSGASFLEPQPISSPDANTATPPRLAVDPAGTFLAIWAPSSTNASVQAARRPRGGAFGGVDLLPRIATDTLVWGPAVAFDDQGNALALWSSGISNGDWTVYGSAFDAAPPTLAAVSVPGTGTAGQPIGMAAAATDRWSPVSISWNFGDGTSGAGDAVTHAFGSAGAFTVTATATDAVGNASSATRSVLVSAAPPPPKKRITSKVRVTWGVSGKRIFLLRLSASSVPKGGKLQLRCKGKKCPYKKRGSTKRRSGKITLFKEIKAKKAATKKKRSFRAKQTLQVRITAKDFIGKVVKYKLKKGKIPSGKTLCLPVGKSKPRNRCD